MAQYWTELLPKELQEKKHQALPTNLMLFPHFTTTSPLLYRSGKTIMDDIASNAKFSDNHHSASTPLL